MSKKNIFIVFTIITIIALICMSYSKPKENSLYANIGEKQAILQMTEYNFNIINNNKINFSAVSPKVRVNKKTGDKTETFEFQSNGDVNSNHNNTYTFQLWLNPDDTVDAVILFSNATTEDEQINSALIAAAFIKSMCDNTLTTEELETIVDNIYKKSTDPVFVYKNIIFENEIITDKYGSIMITVAHNKSDRNNNIIAKLKSKI